MMVSTTTMIRRLADALSRQRQADEHGIYCAVPRQAVDAAIRHLRAQADAQPVAWMHIDGRVISAATMDQAYMDGGAMQSSLRDYTIPLYAHSAPAVPQDEPKREPLTDERIASVCLSYRHDFGLLSGDEQAGLMLEARAWERAFRKEWQR